MEISQLSSAQLKRLITLVKQREAAQAKVERIEREIDGLQDGGTKSRGPGRPRGRKPGRPAKTTKAAKAAPRRRSKRLKEPLLKALKAAGPSGISVKDLSTKLGVKPGNVFSFFYTTGKKIKGISKVGEARYAYAA